MQSDPPRKIIQLKYGRFIGIDELSNGDIRVTLYWEDPSNGTDSSVHELHSVDFSSDGGVSINKATHVNVPEDSIVSLVKYTND